MVWMIFEQVGKQTGHIRCCFVLKGLNNVGDFKFSDRAVSHVEYGCVSE
jgi:hypothetical protein